MVKIKDFSYGVSCENVEQLQKALLEQYTHQSISIIGEDHIVVFTDVKSDGSLIDSYTQKPIALESFFL